MIILIIPNLTLMILWKKINKPEDAYKVFIVSGFYKDKFRKSSIPIALDMVNIVDY